MLAPLLRAAEAEAAAAASTAASFSPQVKVNANEQQANNDSLAWWRDGLIPRLGASGNNNKQQTDCKEWVLSGGNLSSSHSDPFPLPHTASVLSDLHYMRADLSKKRCRISLDIDKYTINRKN